jgi:hypothetical protein
LEEQEGYGTAGGLAEPACGEVTLAPSAHPLGLVAPGHMAEHGLDTLPRLHQSCRPTHCGSFKARRQLAASGRAPGGLGMGGAATRPRSGSTRKTARKSWRMSGNIAERGEG